MSAYGQMRLALRVLDDPTSTKEDREEAERMYEEARRDALEEIRMDEFYETAP